MIVIIFIVHAIIIIIITNNNYLPQHRCCCSSIIGVLFLCTFLLLDSCKKNVCLSSFGFQEMGKCKGYGDSCITIVVNIFFALCFWLNTPVNVFLYSLYLFYFLRYKMILCVVPTKMNFSLINLRLECTKQLSLFRYGI